MFNNKWNATHKLNWDPELQLDKNGFTGFQLNLIKELKGLLQSYSIGYSEELTEHKDLYDENRIVKMIRISLNDSFDSQFWIYHDMAEYNLKSLHHIYEEWGYISPSELYEKYILNAKSIIDNNNTSHNRR